MIFFYSNQPVIKNSGRYFSRMKNFIDFLSMLSESLADSRLVVPCKELTDIDPGNYVRVELPKEVIEVSWYEGHLQAIFRSFTNVFKVRKVINIALDNDETVILAGPGPNSMLYLLSWVLPKSVKFVFFIRGDTARTVNNMYKGSLIQAPATGLVRLFQRRIYTLLEQNRAVAFTYGTKLKELYGKHGNAFSIAPLIECADISGNNHLKRMAADKGGFRVLFVGRLSHEKGILDLVNACADAYKQGQPFQLTVIGHGPLAEPIKEFIHSRALESCVTFVGYVPHGDKLMTYFDRHDLLCLPSYTEGVPRVVIEAFARGLYVTATPVGSIPDLFSEHIHLIENNSPKAILEAIDWCRSHISEVNELAAKLPKVAQLYTLEHHVPIVREQLERLAFKG